jgi:NADH-ubiquinone oxidoreductase chain 4
MLVFFVLAFLIKLPIFGFHKWLTKAHVEAPVVGSMILAGVLLKLGGYGIFRVLNFIDTKNFFFCKTIKY